MPARADPSSPEYQLHGPLSKRREVNIKWRFFTENWKKLYPPIELTVTSDEEPARPRSVGIPGEGLLEGVKAMTGASQTMRPPMPRRQRRSLPAGDDAEKRQDAPEALTSPGVLPSRFLRRRYAELLGKIPILTYTRAGNYTVTLDKAAHYSGRNYPLLEIDATERAWLPAGFGEAPKRSKKDVEKAKVVEG